MLDILPQLGISSGTGILLFFILQKMIEHKNEKIVALQNEATEHRKKERDDQIKHLKDERDSKFELQNEKIKSLDNKVDKHIEKHDDWERLVFGKLEKMDERLRLQNETMIRIESYMRGKEDRGRDAKSS